MAPHNYDERKHLGSLHVSLHINDSISLLSLGRYADAAFAMELAEKAGTKDKTKDIWKSKIDGKLQESMFICYFVPGIRE